MSPAEAHEIANALRSPGGYHGTAANMTEAVLVLDALAKAERAYRVSLAPYLADDSPDDPTVSDARDVLIAAGGEP